MATATNRELDLSSFPSGTITEYTTLVCLACIFDIFTKQLRLAPRTAFTEVKRHTPTLDELTSRNAMRPYFDSEEKNPHCPYCGSSKRWLARFDTYCIEGGKKTDPARRELIKKLPKSGDQFLLLEKKSDSRSVLFEWLDTVRHSLDYADETWLLQVAQMYLERREPKTNWEEIFEKTRAIRRSSRIDDGWESDGTRLFLAAHLYSELVLIQYLVSRSHAHGGMTFDGRLTLMELVRRLRYGGYLEMLAITEREPDEVFEKLIEHLAATHDWSQAATIKPAAPARRTGATKKAAAKKSKRSSKGKPALPEPDAVITEQVKLHYIVDRRDFLEKVKSVYASYAS